MIQTTADIVVVGGGMIGAAAALGAADIGYQVLLLEPNPFVPEEIDSSISEESVSLLDFSLRVSALTRISTGLLEQLGVWEWIGALAQPYNRMEVWDSRGNGKVVFDANDVYENDLGVIAENRFITSALYRRILKHPRIQILNSQIKSIQNGKAGVTCQTHGEHQISCQLLIGADGANSTCRKLASIPTQEWDYNQEAIVATIRTQKSHQGVAYQHFMDTGPIAFLPLKDMQNTECFSSIVWSLNSDKIENYMEQDDKDFKESLELISEACLGSIVEISRRLKFPLRQRNAKRYVGHHLGLVGDAAHTIHPLAGQGANLGFEDVDCLLSELKRAYLRKMNPGNKEVLSRYQRVRQPANLGMMMVMEAFKRGFGSDQPLVTWFRNAGLNQVNRLPMLKKQIIKQAMGITSSRLSYRRFKVDNLKEEDFIKIKNEEKKASI